LCTAWSEWTACGATSTDFFSTKSRTRRCGGKETQTVPREETETGICEGRSENKTEKSCPVRNQMTTKGFCLKLYSVAKNHTDAEAVCKSDGGYLVHIDSGLKYNSVVTEMIIANDVKEDIFIDGRSIDSKWKFTHGSTKAYVIWLRGYPKNVGSYTCLRLCGIRHNQFERYHNYNGSCSARMFFICEIPQYS
jgi:hypothetical protein